MNLIQLNYMKDWRLRKILTEKRKALAYSKTGEKRSGLSALLIPTLEEDIQQIGREFARRKASSDGASTEKSAGGE